MADHAKVHPEQATRKRSMDIGDESSRSVLIQFPKDQILRQAPSTDNYHHGRRNPKRSRSAFCCCLAWFFGSIFFVVVILLIIAGIFYLVLSPRVPQYSVERVETRSFNFSTNSGLTSEFYIAILAENRNSNIGIYYEEGNSLAFFYSGIKLCSGSFPGLYQGHGNVTVLEASLTGSGVPLSEEVYSSLVNQEKEKRVPLEIEIDVPVKIRAGILKLPKITIRVRCTVIMTGLAPNQDTQIESKSCKVKKNIL